MQGSLELASKNFMTGATKLIYAIIYALILVRFITAVTRRIIAHLRHRDSASPWDRTWRSWC